MNTSCASGKARLILRAAAALLALVAALPLFSCGKKDDKDGAIVLAIVQDGALSEEFSSGANPLLASSDTEYALGRLTGGTLMKKTENGWEKNYAKIDLTEKNGRTVATITLDDKIKYFGTGNSLTADRFINELNEIAKIGYYGYFEDFWRSPIRGLAAYRYGHEGLTVDEVPDFDAIAEERADISTPEKYERLLSETFIGGLFEGNFQQISFDGRTFREAIDAGTDGAYDGAALSKMSRQEVCALLAGIYAKQPANERIALLIFRAVKTKAEEAYRASFASDRYARVPEGISGVTKTGVRSLTVTFERVVDRDEAIGMLNLPLISRSGAQHAGDYRFDGKAAGNTGSIVSLHGADGSTLRFFTVTAREAPGTVRLGQASAAVFFGEEKDLPAGLTDGDDTLVLIRIGGAWALYDPSVTDPDALRALTAFD